ncbi:MAG: hypothetical protein NVS3B14_10230 [Ktedonobacteraceae bacterium]
MRTQRGGKPQEKVLACIFVALLLLVAACQQTPLQQSNNAKQQNSAQARGNRPANSSPIALLVSPHHAPAGPLTGRYGQAPASFPRYFSFGVMSPPATASTLDAMRATNGAAFSFRYQYLTGGVNTGRGWETWQQQPGQFATYYMQESAQHSYMPAFVYYEICLTNGPHPSNYCAGHNIEQDTANLASSTAMNAYFANWVLLLQAIKAFGKPVLVIVEPDLWGFLQNAANGSDNAASVPASVGNSGFADAAGFPNNAQGFAWALLHMRDKYAPNAILALHASTWASGNDIATSTDPTLDAAGMARSEAKFLNSAGLVDNPAGVSTWDVISSDVADFDSAQPGGRSGWDRYNHTFPNFARYLAFIGDISQQTRRRIVMWQVPMGNQYFDTMNNSPGHYQDNRAEYILGNVASFAAAGVIAVLFGPGNGGTMNIDAMHDGVTNPAPISSYECNLCNDHVSIYPDDDGGYLRIFVGLYMQHPLAIT